MNSDYTYEPNTLEDELFLAELPVNILISSIENQFDDPLEYRKKDYVQSFITKYELLKDNTTDDFMADVENIHDDFFRFVKDTFEERLGVGFVDLDNMSEDDMHDLVHITYRFFIKNIKKNFVNIVKNYINNNSDIILNNFEKKKDVTSLNFKAEIDDEYDVLVLSELGNIIEYIFDDIKNASIDEFFEYCDDNEYSLELDFVKNAYDNMELTGNFIEKYLEFINPDFEVEIQSKIRNKILKKYPKREKKIDLPEEDNIEDLHNEDNDVEDHKLED